MATLPVDPSHPLCPSRQSVLPSDATVMSWCKFWQITKTSNLKCKIYCNHLINAKKSLPGDVEDVSFGLKQNSNLSNKTNNYLVMLPWCCRCEFWLKSSKQNSNLFYKKINYLVRLPWCCRCEFWHSRHWAGDTPCESSWCRRWRKNIWNRNKKLFSFYFLFTLQ